MKTMGDLELGHTCSVADFEDLQSPYPAAYFESPDAHPVIKKWYAGKPDLFVNRDYKQVKLGKQVIATLPYK